MVDMEEKITELNVSEEAVAETTAEVTEDVVGEMTEEEKKVKQALRSKPERSKEK